MFPGQASVLNYLNSTIPRFLPDFDLSHNPETKGYRSYYGYFIRKKDSFKLKRIRAESVTPKSFDPKEIKFMFIISVTKPNKNKNKENSLSSTVSKPADDGSTIYTQTTQSEQDLLSIQNKRSTFINPTKKTTESLSFTSQCDQQISSSHSQTTSSKYIGPSTKTMSSLIPIKPSKDKMSYIQVGESLLRVRQFDGPLFHNPQVINSNQRSEIQNHLRQVREETDSDPQNSVILDEISITDQIIKELDIEILEPSIELDEEEENPPTNHNLTIEENNTFNDDSENDDYTEPIITVDLDNLTELSYLNQDIITEEIEDSDEEELKELKLPPRLRERNVNRSLLYRSTNSSQQRYQTKIARISISPQKEDRAGLQINRRGSILKHKNSDNPMFQKREQMNNAERARRQEIAQQFEDLFNKIPIFFKEKRENKKSMSKMTCLNMAKNYSLYLARQEATLAIERKNLEAKNHRLRVALQQRLDMLQAKH